ncbi:hypothetical protein KIW84_044371 [Lathyrus oleraceus]|uniref:Aminotransferase-like plant mobile domain-containing protein n=1 Tax=Pisum sativum TaxID=3888 RepID=A0A9D4XIB0_PEA|nr:hypothetical protein KIW84_044371 [Pisum sativum]
MSSLLHLPIGKRLLDHPRITIPDALNMMVTYLGADPSDVHKEMDGIIRFHARFAFLEKLYIYHLLAEVEVDGDDTKALHHRACPLRSYLIYLVDTSIFVDKSVYYVEVVYLRYFIDFERIHEYNWGALFGLYVLEVS